MLPRKEVTNQNQRHSILPGAGPVQLCVISVLNYYIWQTNFHLKENNKSLIMVISHGLNLCLWILHAPRSVPLVSHHFAPSAFPALHSWGSCVKTSLIVQPWTVPLSASVEPIQNQLCYACMLACIHACSVVSWLFVTPRTIVFRLLCPWDFPGKNPGVGCHFLLPGVFLTQGSKLRLLHLLHW